MEEEIRVISTIDELNDYVNEVCTDLGKALEKRVDLDVDVVKPLVLRIPCEEEDIPYITTSWMRVFVNFSDRLAAIMELGLQQKLDDSEKEKLEIKVYIEKGSLLYKIRMALAEFVKKAGIAEVLPEMSVPQILAIVIPTVLGFTFASMFGSYQEEKTKRLNDSLDAQIRQKEIDSETARQESVNSMLIEKDRIEAERAADILDNQLEVLGVIKQILTQQTDNEKSLAKDIMNIKDLPDSIEINNVKTTKADLKRISKKTRKKIEKKVVVVEDYFKATQLSYENPSGNEYLFKNSKYKLNNCKFSKDDFTEIQQYAIDRRYRVKLHFKCYESSDGSLSMIRGIFQVLGYKNENGDEITEEEIKKEMESE